MTGTCDSLPGLITPGQRITNAAMLHGLVQHTVYHAGQIALLKRAAPGIAAHIEGGRDAGRCRCGQSVPV